jgi:hypothetical protein
MEESLERNSPPRDKIVPKNPRYRAHFRRRERQKAKGWVMALGATLGFQ